MTPDEYAEHAICRLAGTPTGLARARPGLDMRQIGDLCDRLAEARIRMRLTPRALISLDRGGKAYFRIMFGFTKAELRLGLALAAYALEAHGAPRLEAVAAPISTRDILPPENSAAAR